MKSIDIKSLLIGILGTALLMVLMGVDKSRSHGAYQISCASLGNPNRMKCVKLQTLSGAIVSSFNCTSRGCKTSD